eukprot:4915552-Ditylum_brightwellii.AAC.1
MTTPDNDPVLRPPPLLEAVTKVHKPKNTVNEADKKQNGIQPMQEQETDKIELNDQEEQE